MKFEWDEAKNAGNQAKHGLSLAEVAALWEGPVFILESGYPGELRKLALGKIAGKHWTVIFTMRGETIRLISARRSRDNERKIYDENNREES